MVWKKTWNATIYEVSQYRGAEANHIHRCFPAAPRIVLSDTIRIWSMFVIEKKYPNNNYIQNGMRMIGWCQNCVSNKGWRWPLHLGTCKHYRFPGPLPGWNAGSLCHHGGGENQKCGVWRGVHFVGMIHFDSLYLLYCCTAWFVCCVFVPRFRIIRAHMMRLKTLEKFLKRKGKTARLINTAYIIHYWLSYVVFSEFSIHHCPIPSLQEPMDQGVDSTVVRHLKVNQLCRSWQRWCGEMRHWRWPTVPSSWMLLPSRKECRLAIVPAFIYHSELRSSYNSFEMMQNAFLGEKEFGVRVTKDKWNKNVHFFKDIFIERYWESVSELVVCLGIQLQLLSRLKILYGHEFPLSLAGMDRQRVQIQEACP